METKIKDINAVLFTLLCLDHEGLILITYLISTCGIIQLKKERKKERMVSSEFLRLDIFRKEIGLESFDLLPR